MFININVKKVTTRCFPPSTPVVRLELTSSEEADNTSCKEHFGSALHMIHYPSISLMLYPVELDGHWKISTDTGFMYGRSKMAWEEDVEPT